MKRVHLRFPPFALLLLAALALAAGIALLFAIAVGQGAPAHVAGFLLSACTSTSQFAGGVISLTLLSLPLLIVSAGLAHGVRVRFRTRDVVSRLAPTNDQLPRELERAAAEAGLADRVDVAQTAELVACTYRLWRPRVLVSAGAVMVMTPAELAAVLAHEAHHVRCRDPLRVYITEVVRGAFIPLPLLGNLARHFAESSELAADRYAMTRAGRRPLAAALVKFLESPRPAAMPCLALESAHDSRVAHLLEPDSFRHELLLEDRAIRRTACTLAAVGLLTAAFTALPPML